MGNIAVSIEGLGKRYRIGQRKAAYSTLREKLSEAAASLLRNGKNEVDRGPREFWALKDLSFEVRHGEVVGVIGRNGAGKSTLLKVLSRITEPTKGRVRVYGRVGSLLEVGTGFHPELTGRENIYLNGAILGMSKGDINRKFDEIVAFAEVERFLDTPVKRYSSGMQLRLGFAVAAHLEPEILVVDEVLAVGDAAFQSKCLGKMQQVANQARTVLFVSHNMPAVAKLCSSAVVLHGGELVFQGPVNEAIQCYLDRQQKVRSCPLAQRSDRAGDRRILFEGVELELPNGAPIQTPICGDDLAISLTYRSTHGEQTLGPVQIGIDVCSRFDERIANFTTTWTTGDFASIPGYGTIRCIIPRLALLPGVYNLDLFAAVGGNQADYIRNAFTFEVVAGDYFGSGKIPNLGYVMMQHRWEMA
jgi:lipopolysaccharide transport system ATP-binding protein